MKLKDVKNAPDEKPDYTPVPPGTYPVMVVDAEPRTARTGTEGVGMKLEILEGKEKGRILFDSLWLTEKAAWRVWAVLGALGFDRETVDDDVPEVALIGRRAAVLVEHEVYEANDGTTKVRATVREWAEHPDGPGNPPAPKVDDVPF